ncbi:MAG TPA: FAD binding domain-containing protein [Anaerolineae bacterium]
MTLRRFQYVAADSLQTAEILLQEQRDKAALVAGGTDVLGVLKDAIHPVYPEVLISLKHLQDLRYIEEDAAGLRIGALTTLDEIAVHPAVRARYPLLAEAARSVASPQIRNVATIGGNLCQEPRCWYYRNPENTFECLRKGGKKCNALWGENRFHSVYGGMCVDAAPCAGACPTHVDIPAYLALIRAGDVAAAAHRLLLTNPIAAITGRVCPHFCETACNRVDEDEAVSIRDVERFLGDYALAHADEFYPAPLAGTGKHVAIAGGGPAGLAAAFYLRLAGHEVTVYEALPEPGGMLMYSIPAYRLPKDVVRALVRALEGMGVRFLTNTSVGSEGSSLADLQARHDALFLATGLMKARGLRIERSQLLDPGLEFLYGVQRGEKPRVGRRVVVIGGGSVAVDVAIGARRQGAEHVTMAFLESMDIMPAMAEDVEQALEEGIQLAPSLGPHRILEQDGKLVGMEFVRCTSVFDAAGRFAPSFDDNDVSTLEADQILVAIGQAADLSGIEPFVQTQRGLITTDPAQATNVPGIFAAGDVARGPGTIVDAIATARKAVASIEAYLGTRPAAAAADNSAGQTPWLTLNVGAFKPIEREEGAWLPVADRTATAEDRPGVTAALIDHEASRCANCGCVAVNASDVAPALIALGASVKTTRRSIPVEHLFAAGKKKTTVLEPDELIQEIDVAAPAPGSRQQYLKFRQRNAIDFPIVSVALSCTMDAGAIHNARVVLNAVAPVPLRAEAVEALLEGQHPGDALAKQAGALATARVQPLARNAYKAEIVKALLRKALAAL